MATNLRANTWVSDDRARMHLPDLGVDVEVFEVPGQPPRVRVTIDREPPTVSDEILNRALQAFWLSVAKSYPDSVTGDLPFDTGDAHDIAARRAIDHWLRWNAPRATVTIDGVAQVLNMGEV